jgi:dehydrogenase/reductase SDR family member 12
MINSLLDDVLDRTVVAGFTNVGYRIRSRGWSASELRRVQGKVVLVTGASSGLGLAAAEGFARLGATVWLVVRSPERGEQARVRIVERSGNGDVHVGVCDLSELESVRQFAGRFGGQASRLDVLVNNAGVMTEARDVSPDGIELTLATNVVGPFLLTNLLIPLLEESAPARVINVSSGGMYTQKLRVDDLQSERGEFEGAKVYARSKRAQVILTEIWAEQFAGTRVVVHSMHPGWSDTPGLRSSLPRFYTVTRRLLRTPAQGADTIVWLGADAEPGRSSGRFWHDRRPRARTGCDRRGRRDRNASGFSPSAYGSAVGTTRAFRPRRLPFQKENLDGPLPSNARHPANARGRLRLSQRFLDHQGMGSGRG